MRRVLQRGAPAVVARSVLATVLLLAGVAGAAGAAGRAAAQSGPTITPFPRPIVAFVPADLVTAASAVDAALATQWVAVAPSDGIGRDASRVVTVGFASPVTLPATDYRVSVVVGVPGGEQTRVSYRAADGTPVGGTVETSTDGRRWAADGATDATLEGDSLRLTAPVGTDAGDAGRGLWLDAQIGTDDATRSTSPVFALDALLGRHVAGALPASPTGALTDPAATAASPVAEPVALPGTPPTLTVDEHLTVTETEPVPATLADQPVVNAIDEITFMPGYTPAGTTPAVVQINRLTGAITLLEGTTGLPTDRTGDGSFVVERPTVPSSAAPSPSSPVRVVLDLAAVAEALDLPLDPDGLGIGLRRKVTLADGRDVIGVATMATLVWYEEASPTASPGPDQAAPTTEAESEAGDGSSASAPTGVVIAVAAGLVLLAVAAVVWLVVRRRRAASVDRWLDEYESDRSDEPEEPEPQDVQDAQDAQEASGAGEAGEASEAGDRRGPEERSPADALASLEAEVSALTERVDRLTDRGADERPPER